ncbi:LPS-assembly protein LptD [Castellaniella caeni]|uniref:LPS-assembly protein LptD n=1 Tax=Castellaniella caeni TaxID=266123 RepID=UPI00083498B4|nr:LPS-assembly protein LptD [Castellaniella caeni]
MHRISRIILLSAVLSAPALADEPATQARGLRMVGSLGHHPGLKDDTLPSFLIGDDITRNAGGRVILRGAAQVRRLDGVIKGERIDYDQATGDTEVRGNGLIMRDGNIVKGPHLRYNVNTSQGEIDQPRFWLGTTGGQGHADHADIISRQHVRLKDVRYTGWSGPDPAWYIDASRVDLYLDENEGAARNGVLRFKDVPILYSPYLTFPLGKDRKSGFLVPTYGTSSNGGFELTTPYYLNLAPNYDATLSPRYLSKRGLLLGTELRHLSASSHSELFGSYIMRDNQTGDKRWMYSVQHTQDLAPGLQLYLDARKVSDDDYFRDFSSFGLSDAAITYMPSQALLTWENGSHLSGSLQFYRYQTLQDSTGSFLAPPYDKLPELHFRAQHYDWHSLDVVSDNYATRFVAPIYQGSAFPAESGKRLMPNGTRLTSYTTVARPFVAPWGYFTPKAGLHMSQYDTDWFYGSIQGLPPELLGQPRSQTRVLPIASVDTGLTLERDTTLFGNDAIQTLEPRLYYLYVPYRDQSGLPVFDTGMASFSYQQAFDENIFSGGWDRIANANQLTAGLTTRWLDADTGFERLSLSLAQRFYFDDQRVTLPGQTPRQATESDYLVGANAALTNRFSVYFDGQFDHETQKRSRLSSGVRWTPKRLATMSLSYRYERDPNLYTDPYQVLPADVVDQSREQVSFTSQWPLARRWFGVGRYDYSLAEKRSTQSIVGLEYRGDGGWAARAVLQRYAVSAEKTNTALFLQLELTGLGSLGTDPMSLLSDRITGYQSATPPTPEKTEFERYE